MSVTVSSAGPSGEGGGSFFQRIKNILSSKDDPHKLCMGAAQGVFWGLTPTVGLQISILLAVGAIVHIANRVSQGRFKFFEFNLPLAIALTFISNPLNMIFIYYFFYSVGVMVLPGIDMLTLESLRVKLVPIFSADLLPALVKLGELGYEVLWPMILGSLIIATPSSIISYMLVDRWLKRRERRAAEASEN